MAKVWYEATYSKSVQVEVSDEELAALKDYSANPQANEAARKRVTDEAVELLDKEPFEWVMATCSTENGEEELFDL